MLNQPNNQPNQNPNNQPNNPQPGFTMQQKFILLSLTLVMVTVATVFLAVLQFYQPKIEPMVIVVTATPELLPTADLGQGQVSDSSGGEPTRTPTVTSVYPHIDFSATNQLLRTPENGTAYAISVNGTIEAMGGMDAVGGYAGFFISKFQTVEAEHGIYVTIEAPPVLSPTKSFAELRPTVVLAEQPECLKPFLTPEADVVDGVGHFYLPSPSENLEVKRILDYSYSVWDSRSGDPFTFQCPE